MGRGYPFTKALCALILVGMLVLLFAPAAAGVLVYRTENVQALAVLLHVLGNDVIGAFLSVISLWWVARSLESDTGVAKSIVFVVVVALLSAIGAHLASGLTQQHATLAGAWVLAGAMMVTWATRYPRTPMRMFFMLDMEGRWLGLIGAALAFVTFKPVANGVAAVLPLAFAWAYAANKLPFFEYGLPRQAVTPPTGPRGIKVPRPDYFDDVKRRETEREEKERLRKLFESSMKDDES